MWSEYYDWEEIEDIERWGLNKDEVLEIFEKNSPENEHCVYTLLESNPFPERMRIFIRANLTTSQGIELKGYVMNEDAFCLGVFHDDKEFIFSRHPLLEIANQGQENELARSLAVETETLFPMRYETQFLDKDGEQIMGEFMYGQEET